MSKKRESQILVLDDDLEIRNLLGKYLASQDFRVSLAADLKSSVRRWPQARLTWQSWM
jgi:two-component system, OmpR family, response regulator